MPHTIEEIHEAFLLMHHVAIGKSDRAYMSIPADPNRDADLIVSAAIDELKALRDAKVSLENIITMLERQLDGPTGFRARVRELEAARERDAASAADLRLKLRAVLEHALLNVRSLTGGDERRMHELLDSLPKDPL